MSNDSEISRLRNLGEKTEVWLNEIGVFGLDDLRRLGSIEIYRLLRQRGYPVSLNLVYSIEGAISDTDWRELSPQLRADLRDAIRRL